MDWKMNLNGIISSRTFPVGADMNTPCRLTSVSLFFFFFLSPRPPLPSPRKTSYRVSLVLRPSYLSLPCFSPHLSCQSYRRDANAPNMQMPRQAPEQVCRSQGQNQVSEDAGTRLACESNWRPRGRPRTRPVA